MTLGRPPSWNSRFAFHEAGFDLRLASWIQMRKGGTPGFVRRIAPDLADPKQREEVDEAKRNMLKLFAIGGLAAVAAGGAVGGALQYVQPPLQGLASYPRVQLLYSNGTPVTTANIAQNIDPTKTDLYIFDYPLSSEPNMLLTLDAKYGTPPNAIGPIPTPNSSNGVASIYVVSYSAICQHLGCVPPFISYYPATEAQACGFNSGKPFVHCICHGSTYDPYVESTSTSPPGGANIITGPTVEPIPQTLLATDSSGNLYAIGSIGQPVKGHFTTLTGGTAGPSPAPLSQLVVGTVATGAQRCP